MIFQNLNYSSEVNKASMVFPMMCWHYMRFKKSRVEFKCRVCQTRFKSEMRYIGDSYSKICMKCAPDYMNNTIIGFEKWLNHVKTNKDLCLKSYSEWNKEALAGAIVASNNE